MANATATGTGVDPKQTAGSGIGLGPDPNVGQHTGSESSLSSWAGPYVTDILGRGQALGDMPYQAYTGPLTAGPSALQQQAATGIAALGFPTDASGAALQPYQPQSFTADGTAQTFMNPYIQQALNPQLDELRRQTDIARTAQNAKLAQAGAYGGSRQALADVELTRAMLDKMAGVTGEGYRDAYSRAAEQFNLEQDRAQTARDRALDYGIGVLDAQSQAGREMRDIEQEGIAADYLQFEEEREFPYKQTQYMQSLLQGLPLAAQSFSYSEPSEISKLLGSGGGIAELLGWGRKDEGKSAKEAAGDAVTNVATNLMEGYF